METVSTGELEGLVPCPHCGNPGHGHCSCGAIICLDIRNNMKFLCPVCGQEGYMNIGEAFDINQSAG
ncbi:MAG: hypothetical protein LBQ86_07115 [Holophagales bacterium]|nr:hypothetical protein [Holophagales bacterium]